MASEKHCVEPANENPKAKSERQTHKTCSRSADE